MATSHHKHVGRLDHELRSPPPALKLGSSRQRTRLGQEGGGRKGPTVPPWSSWHRRGSPKPSATPASSSVQSPGSSPSHLPGPHTNTWKAALDRAGRGGELSQGHQSSSTAQPRCGWEHPGTQSWQEGPVPIRTHSANLPRLLCSSQAVDEHLIFFKHPRVGLKRCLFP